MRIYETLKEGEVERKVKHKEETRVQERIKAGTHLLGTRAIPTSLPPALWFV